MALSEAELAELQKLREIKELHELRAMAARGKNPPPAPEKHLKDYALDAVDTVGRALDYSGGFARIAAGAAGGQYKKEDYARALKGDAPHMSEYMDRAGIPTGAHLSDVIPYAKKGSGTILPEEGGALDPSIRGVVGFAGDVALDPITYLSGGLSALVKAGYTENKLLRLLGAANKEGEITTATRVANNIFNPLEMLSKKGGKAAYRGAFSQVDAAGAKIQNNAETIGELAHKYGFVGNAQQAADFVTGLNRKAGEIIGSTLDEASSRGAKVDLNVTLAKAEAKANALRQSGHLEDSAIADMIDKRVSMLKEKRGTLVDSLDLNAPPQIDRNIPVNEANRLKSKMNSDANFKLTSEDTMKGRSIKDITQPLGEDIISSVGSVDQKLKDMLEAQNARYHSTNDEMQYLMDSWAGRSPQLRNPLTPTKVDLLAMGVKPGASLLKKAGDMVLSTRGRTATGRTLSLLGDSGGQLDPLARQLFWNDMLKQNEEQRK